MLKNKYFNRLQAILVLCVFIMCVLKIVIAPDRDGYNFIDGINLEEENQEYKDLGLNPQVRVLLMTEGFENEMHKNLEIIGEDMLVKYGNNHEYEVHLEEVNLTTSHEYFESGSIKIISGETNKLTIKSYERAYGNPSYYGELEIYAQKGGLVIVNELPLETYLKGVVPSEMPSSYESEALKAQSVCARSYAYNQMQTISYPQYDAHMNDSVTYQVYNNSKEAENTNKAILATAGEKIGINGKVVTTYFFSTSSGHTTDVRAWGTTLSDANNYLQGIKVASEEGDYERDLPWYKWYIEVEATVLEEIIELNSTEKLGKLTNVEILEMGTGGVVLELKIVGSEGEIIIQGENAIRRTLGSTLYNIMKNDGSVTKGTSLLPSAFFTLEKENDNYIISGGGLGHGIGMSQNGANQMAKTGMTYIEILNYFYQNTEIIC